MKTIFALSFPPQYPEGCPAMSVKEPAKIWWELFKHSMLDKFIYTKQSYVRKNGTLQKNLFVGLQEQTLLLSGLAGHELHMPSTWMPIEPSQFHQSWRHGLPGKNPSAP